ncbi:MAG: helix-turn-helix domain-containing protein [Halobacteriota archaeon]
MDDDAEFITRLIGFGLSEKEVQVYLHLLKHGPKTPSPIAKTLKTYPVDIHRTLMSLIEKEWVRAAHDSPTVYAAVELCAALDSTLKKHESELREMEARKLGLQELAKQQQFCPSDDVATFKIIKSNKELIAAVIPLLDSMKQEWLAAVPGLATVIASLFGINDAAAEFIQRGGKVKTIVDISHPIIDNVRELLQIGEEVRHIDEHGLMFVVFDRRHSMTVINIAESSSLNAPMTALWTDDPTYAEYLAATFEMLWKKSVPAEEHIQKLLKQGPPPDTEETALGHLDSLELE